MKKEIERKKSFRCQTCGIKIKVLKKGTCAKIEGSLKFPLYACPKCLTYSMKVVK